MKRGVGASRSHITRRQCWLPPQPWPRRRSWRSNARSGRRSTRRARSSSATTTRSRLDAAYRQEVYEPLAQRVSDRFYFSSGEARDHIGEPRRVAYGETDVETLDIYRTDRAKAPIFVFIHGGTWRFGSAWDYGYPAEMFVKAGAHYVAIDFAGVQRVNGDLGVLATQVRRAIAWVYQNAASFDGDPARLYIGGHSSGGHLCGVALVTDWQASVASRCMAWTPALV
jgi:acetyl esterase/lipase